MMRLDCISKSAAGLSRPSNEDSVYCSVARRLFAVADGVGGGSEGARASRTVCAALERIVKAASLPQRKDEVRKAAEAANREVVEYAAAHHLRQMGSTLALLMVDEDGAMVAHVGDSRVYRFRKGKAELLTCDHSVGAEIAAKVGGELGARYAERSNPLSHVLTRSIGGADEVSLDWRAVDVEVGDRFLVCSDGVHDVIADDELAEVLNCGALADCAARLEKEILVQGAPDNYSFVLIACGGHT